MKRFAGQYMGEYLFGLYGFDWQVGLWPFAVFAL